MSKIYSKDSRPNSLHSGPITDLTSILAKHHTKRHLCADDGQSLIHGLPSDQIHLVELISCGSRELHFWINTNRLNLNPLHDSADLVWHQAAAPETRPQTA